MVLWKWVPVLGSQTSEGAQVPDPFAPSCQCPSILLADDEQVIDCLIHRLQVLHIVKLYQERQSLMLVQIAEGRLPRHVVAPSECLNACRQEGYFVLTHISFLWIPLQR